MRKIFAVGFVGLVLVTSLNACSKKKKEDDASTTSKISFSPASGPMGTLLTITSVDTSLDLTSPTSVSIGGTNAIVLSSSASSIKTLSMSAGGGAVEVALASGSSVTAGTEFATAATTPPATQQGSKLIGSGATTTEFQGFAVALSADGNTALVGGPAEGSTGATWVFTRSSGVWTQEGDKLIGTGNVGNSGQGYALALSADGNTALIGGHSDDSNMGAVWVFTRSAATWNQQGSKLVGTGTSGAVYQGRSVGLSADGNTAVFGGIGDSTGVGAVWVFTRSGSTWTQQGSKLAGSGNTGASSQGGSVAISSDGNTIIVGGIGDNGNIGAAWVFTKSGTTWSQEGSKLVGTGRVGNSQQGRAVAISADGNTAIVSGYYDDSNAGATWVFTRSGTTWTQQGSKLVGTGVSGSIAEQGSSVGLSADGNTAVIGGNRDDNFVGAAWVFSRSGSTWTQQGSKLVGTGATGASRQGNSLALSTDGQTVFVGAQGDNGNNGASWVFAP